MNLMVICDRCGDELKLDYRPHPEEFNYCDTCSSVRAKEIAEFYKTPDKEIIDRAAIKAAEVPIGEPIDFAKCFGFDKEN